MQTNNLKNRKLPNSPGVYLFKAGSNILYVGKATSLKDRVKSYFVKDLIQTRGPLLVEMVNKANKIDFIKTDSVLEALILEASLIKRYQPYFNTKEKDDKSFNYVVITKEDFPRVLIERGRELPKKSFDFYINIFGPFTNSTQLKLALKIIRKIFPFRDRCELQQKRPCFNYQIGLCSGVCAGVISKKDYNKIITNIKLFFTGKKKQIIKNLNLEMKLSASKCEFEKAGEIRNKIFALNHIQDVAIIASEATIFSPPQLRRGDYSDNRGGCFRIETYDVAHLSGTNNVGVMVVYEIQNGEGSFKKSNYRKFKIRESRGNDVGALGEIISRRFKHTEWPLPNLIVVDGGLAQLNMARKITIPFFNRSRHLNATPSSSDEGVRAKPVVAIVAVTKDARHKPKAIIGDEEIIRKYRKEILLVNNESHRFALAFHRQKRNVIL